MFVTVFDRMSKGMSDRSKLLLVFTPLNNGRSVYSIGIYSKLRCTANRKLSTFFVQKQNQTSIPTFQSRFVTFRPPM